MQLNAPRLHELVVSRIITDIASGQLPPGTALPSEADICERFGVSRTVVREATRVLVEKGMLEVHHGRGSQINPPERWNQLDPQILLARLQGGNLRDMVEDLVEVRRMLETEAAGLAARRATPADVDVLRTLLDRMTENLGSEDEYTGADNLFHAKLWEVARNKLLLHMLLPFAEVFGLARRLSAGPKELKASMEGHRAILAAVAAGDEDEARQAMCHHVSTFEANLRTMLQAGLVLGRPKP